MQQQFKIGQKVACRYGTGRVVDYDVFGSRGQDAYFVVQFGSDRRAQVFCAASELSQVRA